MEGESSVVKLYCEIRC